MKLSPFLFSFAIAAAPPRVVANRHGRYLGRNRKRDVCIIGAGAAGVSAAYFLEERGYKVSVFEKLDRVGGKCFSPAVGSEGQRIDLGAVLLTKDFVITREFISKFDIKLLHPADPILTEYQSQAIFESESDPEEVLELATAYLGIITSKYPQLLDAPGFDTASMSNSTLEELALPFTEWLELHSLQNLAPFFAIPVTYFGYGLLSQIPAMYAIKFMNVVNTQSLLAYGALGSNSPTDIMAKIAGGYESLIEAIADSLDDVHLGTDVLSIDRIEGSSSTSSSSGKDKPAILKYREANGKSHEFRCAQVISAFPQKTSLMDFMGLDDREQAIFDKPFTQNYFTSSAKGLRAADGGELDLGTYYNIRFFLADHWDGPTMIFVKAFEDVDHFAIYQYAIPDSALSDEEVCAMVPGDLASYGVTKDDIDNFNHWVYFPAVSPEDIKHGFYEDLEALQGYRNTFYTGGLLNFEIVENVMAYSKHLVETFFPDKNDR